LSGFFDPAFLAGIDRLLAETILFEPRWLRNSSLNAWRMSEAAHPFLIHETAKIEEIDMSEKFDNFCSELRTKINDADKRIKDLKANAVGASEKAKVEAKAQLAALENKAKEQKARTAAAEAKVKTWVEEKKTMTHDKIAQWKEQRDVKRLANRADLSEHYAITAMEIAAAAVDEAERAAVEAVVARMDADGIKAPAVSKSA
jgi:exonuclease VII large subunit